MRTASGNGSCGRTVLLGLALLLTFQDGGRANFTFGRSRRRDGPNFYIDGLALARNKQYEEAIEHIEIAQGVRTVRGRKVPNTIPVDVGRQYQNASDYLVDCFPNRELGVIYYYQGKEASAQGRRDEAMASFHQARQHLLASLEQLPTLRARDHLSFVTRELELSDTGRGPAFEQLSYLGEQDQPVPFAGEPVVGQAMLTLVGRCSSAGYVARLEVNGEPVRLRQVDSEGGEASLGKVSVAVLSGEEDKRGEQRREEFAFDVYQPGERAAFVHTVPLQRGENVLHLKVVDLFGNETEQILRCRRDSDGPEVSVYSEAGSLELRVQDDSDFEVRQVQIVRETAATPVSLGRFAFTEQGAQTVTLSPEELNDARFVWVEAQDAVGNRTERQFLVTRMVPPDTGPWPRIEVEVREHRVMEKAKLNVRRVQTVSEIATTTGVPVERFADVPQHRGIVRAKDTRGTIGEVKVEGDIESSASHLLGADRHGTETILLAVRDTADAETATAASATAASANRAPVFTKLRSLEKLVTALHEEPKLIPIAVTDPDGDRVSLSVTTEKGIVRTTLAGADFLILQRIEERTGVDTVAVRADDGKGGVSEVRFLVEATATAGSVSSVRVLGYDDAVGKGIRVNQATFTLALECSSPNGVRRVAIDFEGYERQIETIHPESGRWPVSCTVSKEYRFHDLRGSDTLLHGGAAAGRRFAVAVQVDDDEPVRFTVDYLPADRALRQNLRMWAGLPEAPKQETAGTKGTLRQELGELALNFLRSKLESGVAAELNERLRREFLLLCGNQPARFNCLTEAELSSILEQQRWARAGLYNRLFEIRGSSRQPVEWLLDCSVRQPPGLNNWVLRFSVRDSNLTQASVLTFELPFFTDDAKSLEAFVYDRLRMGVEVLKQRLTMPVLSLANADWKRQRLVIHADEAMSLLPNMRLFFFESPEVHAHAEPLAPVNGPYYQGVVTAVDDGRVYVQVVPELGNVEDFRSRARYAAVR